MTGPLNIQIGAPDAIRTTIGTVQVELSTLGELQDVDATDPNDGDILQFDVNSNTWVAGPLPEDTDIDGGTF